VINIDVKQKFPDSIQIILMILWIPIWKFLKKKNNGLIIVAMRGKRFFYYC
jgi:hypothetical protein